MARTATPTWRIERCSPATYGKLERVATAWLRPAGPRLAHEYPLLFRDHPDVRHYAAFDPAGEPIAHTATLTRTVVHATGRLRLGMVSNVVTREDRRGGGTASALVTRAVDELRSSGCAVALTWSDREGFYARFGFERMGRELLCTLDPALLTGPATAPVPLAPDHLEGIHRLHERRPVRVERSREAHARLLAIPRMEVLVGLDRSGEVAATLCLGKGEDFRGVIHEIGGEAAPVEALLTGLVRSRPGWRPVLLLPPDREGLIARLRERGLEPEEGVLGLGQMLDPEAVAAFTRGLGALASAYRGTAPLLPFHLGGLDSV